MATLFDTDPLPSREPLEEGAVLLRAFATPNAAALVDEISRIAQAGQDIAVIIQLLVDGSSPDRNVGMFLLKLRNPLGSREQADESNISGTSRFEQSDCGAS